MRKVAPLLLLIALSAQTAPPTAAIEDAMRAQLKDPDSAKFNWPNGFVDGTWRNLYGQKFTGKITCGTMNAKNGFGGYTGPRAIVGIVSADGAVLAVETDDTYQGTINHDYVAYKCGKMGMPVG
jgi:hypothetical protein